jgi:glyoxylase-like metal-dependent hydrolase (beta-lactamase superfamily II)
VTERQVSDRLFETGPGVFRVPVPTTFAIGDVNVWLLDAPRPALVDAGIKGDGTIEVLSAALAVLGHGLADVGDLLLTHGHVDHAGAAAAVRGASGARVWASPRGHRRVSDPAGRFEENLPGFLRFLRRCGFSEETIDKHRQFSGFFLRFGDPCPGPLAAEDGATIEAAGRRLEVLWTPGHSSDHVVFLDRDAGVLFGGDHVLPHVTANPTLEAPDAEGGQRLPLAEYRDSLERVAPLPVRVVCPGHGAPYEDLAGRCRAILEHQEARCARVLDVVRSSGPMTRKDVAVALFGKVPIWEIFLAISEVQAAVGLLASRGLVRLRLTGDGADLVEAVAAPPTP